MSVLALRLWEACWLPTFVCPANRHKTCSDPACGIGAKCKRLAELGLAGDGLAAPTKGPPSLRRSGSQQALGPPPRARRGSQRRNAGGGPRGELILVPELVEAAALEPIRQEAIGWVKWWKRRLAPLSQKALERGDGHEAAFKAAPAIVRASLR